MKKIRTILVDDETEAIRGLQAYLAAYCQQVEICATASSVAEAKQCCRQYSPDLIFLDIEMPGGSGFDLLSLFDGTARPEIIFTTAHAQHAIQAFREGASDYLLKPIDIGELKEAVKRTEARLNAKQALFPVLEARLRILTQNGMEFIPQRNILLIEARGRYSLFHLTDEKILSAARNIGEFEEELAYKGFFRVHKSFLVNCEHILSFHEKPESCIILSNQRKIEVARRKKNELLEYLNARGNQPS